MKKISPYSTGKPFTRWWWFNTRIKEKDIKFQLDWLKKNNFGGVEIAWVYPLPKQPKGPEWLSKSLSELIAQTKKYADKIGLGCDFTFGTLWPFGGTFIAEQDRAQVFGGFSEQRLNRTWEKDSGKSSYIINHLDKNALANYSKIMGQALKDALKGRPSALFCDSWEVETQDLWTPGFDEEFKKRFGYSINEFMGKLDDFPEVRYDYRKLVAEYILNEFYKPFTEICHKLGAVARVQCHGSPTDLLASYSSVDIPESEAILFNPSFSIIPASAAALSEKQIVSCETFTCLYGWVTYPGPGPHQKMEQTADMKLLADALFANGINQIVWHGMPYNPKSGKSADSPAYRGKNQFYASVHVGPDSHFAAEIPAFNAYMTQVSEIMKKGRTYSDVAVYLPIENAWAYNKLPDDELKPSATYHWEMHYNKPATELKGYHPLWVSNYFLKNAKCVKKQLICGNLKFSLLYVYVNWLDREALVEILRLAKKGLPICLINQPKEPGKIKHADYNKMVDALIKLKNVSSDFPKTAVNPPLIIGEHLPDYWCRVDGNDYYIFFAHPKAQNLTYPMSYGQSHTKEEIKKTIAINIGDTFKYTTLVFEPYQSILLHINKKGEIKNLDIKFVPQTPRTPSLLREIKKELKK